MDDLWSHSFFPHSSHPRPLSLLPYSFICCIPSCPDLFQLSIFFFFFCRGRIRGWTGRFYERGVYVSMWVFVTLHLNPHRSFVCFFGLFIVRTLPFSCSSFLQRPSVPTPDYPQQSRTWRLMKTGVATMKTGVATDHSNSLPMKLNAFLTDLSAGEDKTMSKRRVSINSDTASHPGWIESSIAPLPKPNNSSWIHLPPKLGTPRSSSALPSHTTIALLPTANIRQWPGKYTNFILSN